MTTLRPLSGPSRAGGGSSDSTCTPAARSRSSSSRFDSLDRNSLTDSATTGPTPSASASAWASAASRRSSDGQTAAIASAVTKPTWRMPRANSPLAQGRSFERSIPASRLSTDVSLKPSRAINRSRWRCSS